MKTATFPAVLEAQKVVLRRVSFYKSMMEDDAPKKPAAAVKKVGSMHAIVAHRKKTVHKATAIA